VLVIKLFLCRSRLFDLKVQAAAWLPWWLAGLFEELDLVTVWYGARSGAEQPSLVVQLRCGDVGGKAVNAVAMCSLHAGDPTDRVWVYRAGQGGLAGCEPRGFHKMQENRSHSEGRRALDRRSACDTTACQAPFVARAKLLCL